jgi:DHA1 family bicyclomycin/chloramphenicol resistance-like MFS transporter
MAPILAPVIGGQLLRWMPWPGLFLALAGYGLALLVAVGFGLPETLPRDVRRTGGYRATGAAFRELLGQRRFVGYTLASGLVFGAMFSYIAGSPFVLQQIYRLTPTEFSLAFGANAVGLMAMGQLNGLLLRWWGPRRLLGVGLGVAVAGGAGLLVAAVGGLGLAAVLPAMFALVSSVGMVAPNATALALAGRAELAGSASALLGVLQYLFGAGAAPLVGAFASGTAVPMAVLICGLTVGAALAFVLLTRARDAKPVAPATS